MKGSTKDGKQAGVATVVYFDYVVVEFVLSELHSGGIFQATHH